ncbi:MAG: cyclic nucleotide-binding domain-containing protein [Acidiferrobacter sp.]
MITDIIDNPVGLYVLTAEGDLGVFAPDKNFQIDQNATSALRTRSLNMPALRDHLARHDTDRFRVGVVGRASGSRDWGQTSLFLEESAVRELYPVSGSGTTGLTTFQKKNQEKSLYRGMELLLEYQRMQYPGMPVYCPVLFDRGVTLDRYPGITACLTPENAATRALDVLNLVAVVPMGQRHTETLNDLKARLHSTLIRKEQRRTGQFELLNTPHPTQIAESPIRDLPADGGLRINRAVTLTEKDVGHVRTIRPLELTERWHENAQNQTDAGSLRAFTHFHDLGAEALSLIAAKSSLYTALPGTRLLEQDMINPWNLYLLEGSVSLASNDRVTVHVEAGTNAAKSPIAFLKPRKYTVTALSKVSFWWIPDVVLKCAGIGV